MLHLLMSFADLKQLLQLVLYISLPLILLSLIITTILHYRRKRNNRDQDLEASIEDNVFLQATPVLAMPKFAAGETADYTLLNYGKQLEDAKERYQQLSREFDKLKTKYQLALSGYLGEPRDKAEAMVAGLQKELKTADLKVAQLQQALEFREGHPEEVEDDGEQEKLRQQLALHRQKAEHLQAVVEQQNRTIRLREEEKGAQETEINKLSQLLKELQATAQLANRDAREQELAVNQQLSELNGVHFEEKNRIQEQLRQLEEAYKKIQEENAALQQQLSEYAAVNGGSGQAATELAQLQQELQQSDHERENLKKLLEEQGYLNELVEEKKRQIIFLQQQLEEKVRTAHQAGQQHSTVSSQLREAGDTIIGLKQQLSLLDDKARVSGEEAEQLRQAISRSEGRAAQLQEALTSQSATSAETEKNLAELKERYSRLEQQHNGQEAVINELSRKLSQVQLSANEYEQRWEKSSRLISHIYRELEGTLHDAQPAPVLDEV